MNCPTCGQPVPDPTAVHYITDAELDALSAWWWTRTTKAAAHFLGCIAEGLLMLLVILEVRV